MAHVDCLSRNPVPSTPQIVLDKILEKRINITEISSNWLLAEQQLDPDIVNIVGKINSDELHDDIIKTYDLRKGVLFRKIQKMGQTRCLPVVPRNFRWSVVNQVHESIMHLG